MAFGNGLSVGCGCCGPPEEVCPPTFLVQDCAGSPIEGATVTITDSPPGASGTTGPDGIWAPPNPPGVGSTATVSISHGGVSLDLPGTYGNSPDRCDDDPIAICYDRSVVTITTTPGSILDSPTPPGVTLIESPSGTFRFLHESLRLCSAASALPIDLEYHFLPPDGDHRDACGLVPMECNGDVAVDATLFDYPATHYTVEDGACAKDYGCEYGGGPDYRGLVSKKMEVQWTSLDGSNYFADDEGQWITLDGSLDPTFGASWDSGCLGPKGNFMSVGGSGVKLNVVSAPETQHTPFGSTRTGMTCTTINYVRFGNAACSIAKGPGCSPLGATCTAPIDTAGNLCNYCETVNSNTIAGGGFGIGIGPDGLASALMQSPCDFTYTQYNGVGAPIWQVHVRETV